MNYRQILNKAALWERQKFEMASHPDFINNKARRKANRHRYQAKKMRATGQYLSLCFGSRVKHHSSRRFVQLHQGAYD